jgi:hypothetical protein
MGKKKNLFQENLGNLPLHLGEYKNGKLRVFPILSLCEISSIKTSHTGCLILLPDNCYYQKRA